MSIVQHDMTPLDPLDIVKYDTGIKRDREEKAFLATTTTLFNRRTKPISQREEHGDLPVFMHGRRLYNIPEVTVRGVLAVSQTNVDGRDKFWHREAPPPIPAGIAIVKTHHKNCCRGSPARTRCVLYGRTAVVPALEGEACWLCHQQPLSNTEYAGILPRSQDASEKRHAYGN